MLNPYHLAVDVDRCLKLNLSNGEFERLVEIIEDSEDPEKTSKNMIECGERILMYILSLD
jgi:hypothetical protein